MNKPKFEDSLAMIEDALKWAEKQDVARLRRFLIENANIPLYTFASGGNFSAIDYCAMLYETNMSMSKALTPLMMASISDETLKSSKILIYSGEGNGVDEKYIVRRAAEINPKGTCGITRNNNGKTILVDTLRTVTNNWFVYDVPRQNKPFIETVSTIADFGLFYKAFTNDNTFVNKLNINLEPNNCYNYSSRINGFSIPLFNQIKNYIVLYSSWSKPVAYDFESKMVECGIASVQLSDYRNFCHGRFIFLSRNFEDTALVLFITPREIDYVNKLINGKVFRGNEDIFPSETPIITISTGLDNPLASIELLIKAHVCFNDIAKSFNVEPCAPNNPKSIRKDVPRNIEYDNLKEIGALNSHIDKCRKGTMNSVDLRKPIKYNPKKRVNELAAINGVSEAKIRKFIAEQKIDRRYDEQMCLYNSIRLAYMEDTNCTVVSIANKLSLSLNTVKKYINMEYPNFKLANGKTPMACEDSILKKLRKEIETANSRFPRVKAIQCKHPEYDAKTILNKLPLENDSKGINLHQIECFMNMERLSFYIKNKRIEYVIN